MIIFVVVLKSDYANGLFGFEGLCQPFAESSEGASLSCVVRRARGNAGFVTLTWQIVELINNGSVMSNGDFNSSTGELRFQPGQLIGVSRRSCKELRLGWHCCTLTTSSH